MTDPSLGPDDRDPEAPEADLAEQRTPAAPDGDADDDGPTSVPFEADPADATEQRREIGHDDDDYR
jgi:hypothetical protein